MKKLSDIKQLKLYLGLAAVFLFLNILGDIHDNEGDMGYRAINQTWLVLYLSVANYWLLERTLPKLSWRKPFRAFFPCSCMFSFIQLGYTSGGSLASPCIFSPPWVSPFPQVTEWVS